MAEVYQIDLDEEFLSHLAEPESVTEIRGEHIALDLIEDDFVRDVYQWQINHIREHGKPATASVLAEEFDLDLEDPLTAVGDLLYRLRDRWIRNNARSYMEQVSDAYKEDPAKVAIVMPKVARELIAKVTPRGETYGSGDFERVIHHYDQKVLRGPGPSFGFAEVDEHFHGLLGLNFTIAAPKTYKSWLEVNMLKENVLAGRYGELFSLELPAVETDMRLRCLVAGVPFWKYLRNSLSLEDRENLREASELLDSIGAYRITKPEPGHRTIEEMVESAADRGAEYVLIDQLQYIETQSGKQLGAGDHKDYWQPLNKARDLSDQIPIHIVHQFNRSVMGADRMPEMQQAKGAAAIEEVATLALGLWANKDMRRSNVVELGTLASRHYQYEAWEVGIELSRSCDFELLGRAQHDDGD